MLTLFHAAGLAVGGDGGGSADVAARIAALEAGLAAAKAEAAAAKKEARRLGRLNARLVALAGGGGPALSEPPSPVERAPAPDRALSVSAPSASPLLARLASPPGSTAVAVCGASGVAAVGCGGSGSGGGGPPAGLAVRLLSLLAPASPARVIALPDRVVALAGGGGGVGGRAGVWSLALRRGQAAVLFGSPPAPSPAHGGLDGGEAAPAMAAIAVLDLTSCGVVAAWPCVPGGPAAGGPPAPPPPQRVVWLEGSDGPAAAAVAIVGAAAPGATLPTTLLAVYDLNASSAGEAGRRPPTPGEEAAWRAGEAAGEAARARLALALPPGAVVLAAATAGSAGAALVRGARGVEVWLCSVPARAVAGGAQPPPCTGVGAAAAAKRARPD